MTKQCDIVLPVYSGLAYVRKCVETLLAYTPSELYHLYIMDDRGDDQTFEYMKEIASQHDHITCIRNEKNLGFLKNCNKGMALGDSPFVLLLNSDVMVTPGWLEGLLACAAKDEKIAGVNPLTNYASGINQLIMPGFSFLDMHAFLQKNGPTEPADVVTSVGFCLMLRRSALDEVGLFDEIYGMGYCEESDLAMRLTTSGWRTVVAPNVFVYHKGRATFTNRDERYFENRKIFDKRWLVEYKRQFAEFQRQDTLGPARSLFTYGSQWAPKPAIREMARRVRKGWQKRYPREMASEFVHGLLRVAKAKRPVINKEYYARYFDKDERLKVTYVLPTLALAGGVLSVVQLVNEMTLLGIEARIVALYERDGVRDWPFFCEPILFSSHEDMHANFPPTDIVVATHWMTASHVKKLHLAGKAKKAAYFLQDYEAWFYPENEPHMRDKVKATYDYFKNKIVKSDWLAGMLEADGHDTTKIRLGMNLDVYYPRAVKKTAPTVMAMVRPSTPRRGYEHVMAAMRIVKKERPDTHIILFGETLAEEDMNFECELTGPISNQNELAGLYSKADVFLDGSTFQGFGRPALEAMACGATCVLTNVGGVNEYAKDGKNCILVEPEAPEAFANAIIALLDDKALRDTLIAGGFETAKDYCHRREGIETAEYFKKLMS